jgi:hypothetical protein
VTFVLETGDGQGDWTELQSVEVETKGYLFIDFPASSPGEWIRLRAKGPVTGATAVFTYRADDPRGESADPIFDGLAKAGQRPLPAEPFMPSEATEQNPRLSCRGCHRQDGLTAMNLTPT